MGEFQSGQMGQTVNLLLVASVVRIHPLPPQTPRHFVPRLNLKLKMENGKLSVFHSQFSTFHFQFSIFPGGIAQLGECLTGSQEVTGSSPVISINKSALKHGFSKRIIFIFFNYSHITHIFLFFQL